jgi:hypothetical protein
VSGACCKRCNAFVRTVLPGRADRVSAETAKRRFRGSPSTRRRPIPLLALWVVASPALLFSQTGTASAAGTVVDGKTHKPIPAAIVAAIRADVPSLRKAVRSGGDGAFRIDNLPAGPYSLCVQTAGEAWLDPCQWNGTPAGIVLTPGQAATGVSLRLAAASVLKVDVKDPAKLLEGKKKDGRRPDLAVGVWGPGGLYYPARALTRPGGAASPQSAGTGQMTYGYRLTIPRDTPLKLHVSSKDVRLGDAAGTALAGSAVQQTFQHAAGDENPKSFVFTVLGLLP